MAIVGVSIDDFLRDGCGCNLGENKYSCLGSFPKEDFISCRDYFLELSNEEKDMFLLSFFAMNRVPNRGVDRTHITKYKMYGHEVCKN